MAINTIPFATSLVDSNGNVAISLNAAGDTLTINDKSNYLSNNESGHVITDFSYFRRVLIEHYKGTILNLSSLGDGDVLISAAISGTNVFNQLIKTGDGRYKITLRSVPNWRNNANYNLNDDYVFVPGLNPSLNKFYQALTSNNNLPPASNPNDWQEVPEASLPVKYNTSVNIAIDTAARKCLNDKVHKAVCKIGDAFCNDDLLCKNPCFLAATKLLLLIYEIQIAVQNQNNDQMDTAFDLVAKICNCPCPC